MMAPSDVVGKKGESTFRLFAQTHQDHLATHKRHELSPLGRAMRVWTARCPCGDYLVVKVDDDRATIPVELTGEVFGRVS